MSHRAPSARAGGERRWVVCNRLASFLRSIPFATRFGLLRRESAHLLYLMLHAGGMRCPHAYNEMKVDLRGSQHERDV
ncbi:MAG TPA: hypothetical protein VGS80_19030 [Ktedonobacterales bacterium]|nr:hypothetical protein [Ktedonobacterales bacterium]